MSLLFEFGSQAQPIGNFDESAWLSLKPNWKQIRTVNSIEVKFAGQACGEVDALWTRQTGLPIAVTTADCVPILLYRKDETAIAVIHAGWEGTLQRIVPKFFASLPDEVADPTTWVAMLGPSIRACCYEFGEELILKFYTEFSDLSPALISPSERRLDLIAVLNHELTKRGVELESLDPRCTHCTVTESGERVFLSYRRGDRLSRQYSIIMKK